MGGQEMAQLQHSQEFVEKVNSTEVRQTSMITADFYISRRIRHFHEFLTSGYEFVKMLKYVLVPVNTALRQRLHH